MPYNVVVVFAILGWTAALGLFLAWHILDSAIGLFLAKSADLDRSICSIQTDSEAERINGIEGRFGQIKDWSARTVEETNHNFGVFEGRINDLDARLSKLESSLPVVESVANPTSPEVERPASESERFAAQAEVVVSTGIKLESVSPQPAPAQEFRVRHARYPATVDALESEPAKSDVSPIAEAAGETS